ncbi:unnamed protein product, partial [Urochloa humidicola]
IVPHLVRIQSRVVLAANLSANRKILLLPAPATPTPPTPLPQSHPPPSSSLLLREGRHPGGRPATLRKSRRATKLYPSPRRFRVQRGAPTGGSVAEGKRGDKGSRRRGGMMNGRSSGGRDAEGEWEVRPGGMLVQRRDGEAAGPAIRIRVSHGATFREVIVPAQATFGELKSILVQTTGVEPERQRHFFRGKEKSDGEFLRAAGVKDGAKLLLLEKPAPATMEQKAEPVIMDESMMKACEAVGRVRSEVDKLSAKVCDLEKSVLGGRKVEDKEFIVLTELLMMQLLKLDGIEAEGEARAQRKAEVRRVQSLVETLDKLKARNANPFSDHNKAASVTTQWETFENGMGSLSAPPPRVSSTQVNTDWEQFD